MDTVLLTSSDDESVDDGVQDSDYYPPSNSSEDPTIDKASHSNTEHSSQSNTMPKTETDDKNEVKESAIKTQGSHEKGADTLEIPPCTECGETFTVSVEKENHKCDDVSMTPLRSSSGRLIRPVGGRRTRATAVRSKRKGQPIRLDKRKMITTGIKCIIDLSTECK